MTELRVEEMGEVIQEIFQDRDGMRKVIMYIIKAVLEEEITQYIGAGRYERTEARQSQRNGTKLRGLKTRIGKLLLPVPQSRDGKYSPSLWERYQRSEKALLTTIAEMYYQGVSTRKVGKIMEEMGGFEVSSSTVSAVAADLDEMIEAFRNRPLDKEYPYLIVDARYEKVREMGRIVRKAVMIIMGVNEEGYREILDYGIADLESEATWGMAFKRLRERGVKGVEMITSDKHGGIVNAIARYFPSVGWQRCWVHFQRDMMKQIQRKDRGELAADLRRVITSGTIDEARLELRAVVEKWADRRPRLADIIESGAEECFTIFSICPEHRRHLYSSNMIENTNKELKRRSRVVGIFPNSASVIRLFGAHLIELNEKWQTQKKQYLDMSCRTIHHELEVVV